MKRPIEKLGWCLCREEKSKYVYTKEIITLYIYKDGRIETFVNLSGHIDEDVSFTFEELQAIYKTAKQIKEEYERTEKETNENAAEELKRYEEKFSEDCEEYKKAGYRELEKEEISTKSCWTCSHFRGGYIGMGCWCSEDVCVYKENENILVPQ